MINALRHRGPDGEGIHNAKGACLGHRRLSIIDLNGGDQPIVDTAAKLSITFNGEIYNYKQLRGELIREGVQFSTESDTEVILRLYQSRGRDVLKSIRGMFAFAIWDEDKQELFAARDHLGQKPFYYHSARDSFAFSSEIKGLLAFDASLRELDYRALDQYFSVRVIGSPYSMFQRVRKLPPGHCLTYSIRAGLEVNSYWDLNFEPKSVRDESEILDELEARLIESIRLHMVSDVPVGAFISGGLDSTLVAAIMMKHVTSDAIPTFTLGLPHEQYNEAPLARLVAEQYGSEHHEHIEIPSVQKHLPDLVYHLDEPSDPLSVCTYLISRTVREHVKVVLGGDGGDELFGGYDRYYGNVYAGYYALIPRWVRSTLIGPVLGRTSEGNWYKSKVHQLKWLHRLSFSQGGQRYAKSLSYFYFADQAKSDLYGESFVGALSGFDGESLIAEAYDSALARSPLDRMLSADDRIRMPDHPVMVSDRMTMAHGLEVRSPFMDHTLVEFMAQVPTPLKVCGRKLRYLQRRLAERYLPERILKFPKQGFSSPLPYLLREEYVRLFDSFLTRPMLADAGIINLKTVQSLLRQHLAKKADHGNRLWLLLNAEVWYRMHICGISRQDIRDTTAFA